MSRLLLPNESQYQNVHPPSVYVDKGVTWAYKVMVRNLREDGVPGEEELNELGQEGWGLAGTITDSPFVYLYFIRLN